MRKSILFIASALLLSQPMIAGEARIHGFFIQPELGYGATDYQSFGTQKEWNDWLGSMKALGADKLFYQWSVRYQTAAAVSWYASSYAGAPSPGDYAHYDIAQEEIHGVRTQSWSKPTSWPGTPSQGGKESITYLLDAAANNGMKVWLGLYLCEQDFCSWWSANDQDDIIDAADSLAIEHNVLRSIQVAQDLIDQYGDHPGLGGLYYSIEPANISFMHENTRPVLASAIDRVAKAVHVAKPGLKLAICPFFNVALSTAQEFAEMWDYILKNSELDLLMLQDGAGVEPWILTATNDQVTEWYRELNSVAKSNGVEFWGNAELFTNLNDSRANPDLVPSTLEQIKRQLNTGAPYVDQFVCFAFSYLDPNHDIYNFSSGMLGDRYAENRAARQALYDAYKAYYDSNEWEEFETATDQPQTSSLFSFNSVPGGALVIWNGAATRWSLFDLQGQEVVSGWLAAGENLLGWGPLAQGRYFWRAGHHQRPIDF